MSSQTVLTIDTDTPISSTCFFHGGFYNTSSAGGSTLRLSALQAGLFATSISQPGTWTGSHVFPLPSSLDLIRFKSAWSTVVQQTPILRSRIVWHEDSGPGVSSRPGTGGGAGMRLLVLDEDEIEWEERESLSGKDALAATVTQLRMRSMGFGEKLTAYTILRIVPDGPDYFIWTMHHALYDNSHLFVLDDVLRVYHNHEASHMPARPSFTRAFLDKQLGQVDYAAASSFWTHELMGYEDIVTFPPSKRCSHSTPAEHPQTRVETPFAFRGPKRTIVSDASNSTLLRAAWAIVVAKHTASKDVVFGSTVAGRYDEQTKGIVGPTFATVPVRVRLDDEEGKTLAQYLQELHVAAASAREHEQVGLQFIRDLNPSAKRAASFQNLLVVQPKNHPTPAAVSSTTTVYPSYQGSENFEFVKTHLDLTQTYGLVMEVTPSSSGTWLLVAKYDDRLLSATDVQRICCHFSKAILEVFKEENRDVELYSIDLLTVMDLEVIGDLFSESHAGHDAPDGGTPTDLLLHQDLEWRAALHPDSVAVDSWDSSLTYAQLNEQSTALAQHVYHKHLQDAAGTDRTSLPIIPISFSKSANAIVAMLAVLKAGCAYLPLDAGWPNERIAEIIESAAGGQGRTLNLVLCDELQKPRLSNRCLLKQESQPEVLAVGKDLLDDLQSSRDTLLTTSALPSPASSDLAYIIFTSGSTGVPKGIGISHMACARAFRSRLSLLRSYDSTIRALQFSSFAFDVSVFDIFGTLSAGGCIVIPHESYRMNPSLLSRFMTERCVNWASLTPSFAEFLNPADVPTLKTMILGGEMLTKDIILRWKSCRRPPGMVKEEVRLGNELGPSETCVACVGNYDVDCDTDPRDLGGPIGGNKLFLVDRDDPGKLVPVGCVGELVVCGESLMDGYFRDPSKTEQVFVDVPSELRALLPSTSAAHHRKKAFRTGDLFYLNDKAHLMFVGRKDRQLKLRGFRIEAEEIEGCLKLEGGVRGAVLELVHLQSQEGNGEAGDADHGQELVAFFSMQDLEDDGSCDLSKATGQTSILSPSSNPQIPDLVRRMKSRVHDALPHYMAPLLYVPVLHIPMTRSGKQDRKQLRTLLACAAPPLLQELHGVSHIEHISAGPRMSTVDDTHLSPIELELKVLWAIVLGLPRTNHIGRDSDFFHLGGNSIKAIRLSQLATKMGWGNLNAVGIYENPTLRDMAALCSTTTEIVADQGASSQDESKSGRGSNDVRSIDEEHVYELRRWRICDSLGLELTDVEDVYPCTPLQEGLVAIAISQPGTYVVARVWRLSPQMDVNLFRDAWELTIERNEILRTIIAEDDQRFWQVVVAYGRMRQVAGEDGERTIQELNLSAENEESVRSLCHDQQSHLGSIRRLSFFEILREQATGHRYFKWTMHHAVYDACVLSMVWAQVKHHYQALKTRRFPSPQRQPGISFAQFVRSTYPSDDVSSSARSFWQTYLSASEPWPTFPVVSRTVGLVPQTDSVISRYFDLDIHTLPGVTEASLIRAAWAWVQSLYLGVEDVLFGVTLSGRSASGASNVVGPTITTVPVRIALSRDTAIQEFLARVQKEANAMMRHEHTGLSKIKALSESAAWACDFANLLIVQDNRGQGELAWDGGVEAVSADTDIRHSIPLVLECVLEDGGGLRTHAVFNSKLLRSDEVDFLLAHLGKAVESLSEEAALFMCTQTQASVQRRKRVLGDIGFLSQLDEAWITSWNHKPKSSSNRLIHDVFRETAQQCGSTKTAIDAWDVRLTYEELDRATDVFARKLAGDHGVGPGVLVAVSFEKSGWAVVAMLSVWKAGGGFIPLDLNHPVTRLREIVQSTRAKTAVCSTARVEQLRGLLPAGGAVLALNQESLDRLLKDEQAVDLRNVHVTPRDICYVLFTSGTTGRPKGVVLEHASVCTSLLGHADPMSVTPTSRVLQFAAYTFDSSIGEIFTALLVGATLCVPSEYQRMDALTEFINEKAVNWVWLTPTVAGLLDPRTVPGVKGMAMGGEPASAKLFRAWVENGTSIAYGYGPTETSITVTLDTDVTVDTDPAKIGRPICASTWVVDPRDDAKLLPVGCVGELVVSGPTVGRGYLDDELKTRMAFGEIPDAWERLVERPVAAGNKRRERFYKTGDLVRYDVTGNIIFVGRKDAQIKFHGQRIELPEITNRVDQILGDGCFSLVDKIETSDADGEAPPETLLVAFFTLPRGSAHAADKDRESGRREHGLGFIQRPSPAEIQVINVLETKLQAVLPRYMIPSLFLPLRSVPVTTTGKVDHGRLKKDLLQVIHSAAGLGDFMPERDRVKEQPRDEQERKLVELWCPILGLPAGKIGIGDSFLRLGGDSLRAVALVHAARRAGLHLSVADVFSHPVLYEMAQVVRDSRGTRDQGADAKQQEPKIACAFGMLKGIDVDVIKSHASGQCGVAVSDIEGLYPCTAMQVGMIVASSMSNNEGDEKETAGLYVLQRKITFESSSSAAIFSTAWDVIRRKPPILRTRVIQFQSLFYQAVLNSDAAPSASQPPGSVTAEYCGKPLAELRIELDSSTCEIFLHHSIYDAVLLPRLLEDIRREYLQLRSVRTISPPLPPSRRIPFRDFIQHLQTCDEEAASSFWSRYLAPRGSSSRYKIELGTFPPSAPQQSQQAAAVETSEVTRYFEGDPVKNKTTPLGITLANVITCAWAVVVARYTGAEQVTFGTTLSGRDVIPETAVPHCQDPNQGLVEGPTFATVPLRFQVDGGKSVTDLLHEAQCDAVEVRRHQHWGMSKIAKAGDSTFRTLLVVQTPLDAIPCDEDVISARLKDLPGLVGLAGDGKVAKQEYPLVLECLVDTTKLTGVRAYYDARAMERSDVDHLLAHFEQAIRTLVRPSSQHLKLDDIDLVTAADHGALRRWNANPPRKSHLTLLDLFLDRARTSPGHNALYSTGMTFSYEELDRHSSRAAQYISQRIGHRDAQTPFTVAVCYEKNVWAVVSILAIMKIGAAYVPLDPSSPDSRLDMILDDVKASAIVCSQKQAARFAHRAAADSSSIIPLEGQSHNQQTHKEDYHDGSPHHSSSRRTLTAESLAYILYTSGSTGKPKGVVVSHGAICTSILAFSPVVKLSPASRVLQFSSFGFDASVGEIFATLGAGGCICLPSDEERLADVSKFINESQANWAFLTPVMLRVITPDEVPLLRVLIVGGEPLPPSLFKTWARRPGRDLELMEAYGPTECCVFSTMNTAVTPDTHPQDIGARLGGAVWIVDPLDYHKLTPVGCVGELVISGHTLAARYHNLPATSTSGFVEHPPRWASLFPDHDLRRFYRTGDLVRFKTDGSIHYVGRKDNQVNLRGMRMELGEIEYNLARSAAGDEAAPIVVMTKIPGGGGGQETEKAALVCFFVAEVGGRIRPEPLRMTKKRRATVESIVSYLEGKVPPYMIPNIFIPLPCFPENTSGKVERKVLVDNILGEFDEHDFNHYTLSSNTTKKERDATRTMNANEKELQQIWSQLLGIDPDTIEQDNNLLRLGGDSIDIIRMVSTLRQKGLHLNPVEAMADPKLSSVASKITPVPSAKNDAAVKLARAAPFSLLRRQLGASGAERLAASAAKQCSVTCDMVEDIYPSTALQEGLLSVSERNPEAYWYRQTWSLKGPTETGRFAAAYRALCQAHPILRTRIVRGDDGRCYQVVLRDEIPVSVAHDGDDGDAHTTASPTGTLIGRPLHFAAFRPPAEAFGPKSSPTFVRILHHALYDAWSLANLDTELSERYQDAASLTSRVTPSYTRFIEHISKDDSALADEWWKQYLGGARQTCWPLVPDNRQPRTTACIRRTFELELSKSRTSVQDHSKSAVARLAWAILLSKYANETDVSFGVALSGRDAPVEGIEEMTGPTNATIPVRYQLLAEDGSSPSIANMLESTRTRAAQATRFQHHGLQNIMRISSDARNVSNTRSLLVVQPARQLQRWEDSRTNIIREVSDEAASLLHPYPVVIELCFQSQCHSAEMWVHYDEQLLSGSQADLIVHQFHMMLQALISSDPSTSIDALEIEDQVSPMLMKCFHDETCRAAVDCDIVSLMAGQRALSPEAPAISAWDGEMTYADLDATSSTLSAHLRGRLGLTAGSMVAIVFEKSIWPIVAMLAVMKAGCAYVPIDPSAPDAYKRLQLDQIAAQGHGNVVLTSEAYFESMRHIASPRAEVLTVTKPMVSDLPHPRSSCATNMALSSSPAYVLFTSGSTGVPKGVIMEHGSACASILSHGAACHFGPSTRALQFAAFTFDASIMEIWTTLAFGGCICLPSDSQRVDNLERYLTDARVSWAFLTPTVSGLIRKESVHGTLRTLVLGGEALNRGNIEKWTSGHESGTDEDAMELMELMNGYGPTECCVFTCVQTKVTPATDPQDIGRAVGVSAWVVDPNDHNRLMPLTWSGELVIVGPALAREYLGDSAKTARAFVYPKWATGLLGSKARAYRTGDLASIGVDGRVRILGRLDGQIKLRGMRLEAGEIENAILSCASAMAFRIEVVVCKGAPPAPDSGGSEASGVVAFLKFGSSSGTPGDLASFGRELAKRMATRVPDYMIPGRLMTVSEFPMTTAGKVDRAALGKLIEEARNMPSVVVHGSLLSERHFTDDGDRPESVQEIMLRDLWAEVFQIEEPSFITRHDDFFGLGGESIRAIRLVAMARERFQMSLTVNGIFRHPCLSDMARQMNEMVDEVVEDQPFDLLLDD